MPTPDQADSPSSGADSGPAQLKRIGWLHFLNDLTLDFLTPLLSSVVGLAWIGAMEGIADGVGQILKLITGRASDASGRRAAWVRWGYLTNAIARPISAVGWWCAWPAWIIACRIVDRIGKGIRGSATDALVCDWSEGTTRTAAFARMRTMDHLGATLGALGAALVAATVPAGNLGFAIITLAAITLIVLLITRGLRDTKLPDPVAAASQPGVPLQPARGWWPRSPQLQRPLLVLGIAALATRISPLLVLMHISGAGGSSGLQWSLPLICLGWAGLGLIQAGASAASEWASERIGVPWLMRASLIGAVAVFAGLALASGPWLIVAGIGFGLLIGLNDGVDKMWLGSLVSKPERAISFGAFALVTAIAGMIANAACGLLLVQVGVEVFWVLGGCALLAIILMPADRTPR